MDETALSALDNPRMYGRLRVGGSIGWGLMVLATGWLIDHLGFGLPVIFYLHILFNLLFILNIGIMPAVRQRKEAHEKRPSLKSVWEMLRKPGFALFLAVIIIWGIGESSIQGFLFLHIKSLGGSSTLMGTALSVSLIGEILVFSFADRIQKHIGPHRLVLAAFAVLVTWLTGLSLIRDPNAIPFFQVFGGAGFALLQSGSVAYVDKHAPGELGTTAQAIRGGLYSGFGVGVGTIISGRIYQAAGSVMLFRSMALAVLGGLIFGVIAFYIENRRAAAEKA
jgi:PPP family 3-phenylpropionic acid transporter